MLPADERRGRERLPQATGDAPEGLHRGGPGRCPPRPARREPLALLRLLLLFIVLPAVELYLLLVIGARVGLVPTVGLIMLTGALGAFLARGQGLRVLGEIRQELEAGRLPADSLIDGVLVLLAAAVLVTPGILTDAFGFLCLVPAVRSRIRKALMRRFERAVAERRVHVEFHGEGARAWRGDRPMKDITPPRDGDER